MSDAINRPIGGIFGRMHEIGVDLTLGSPNTWDFSINPTIKTKQVPRVHQGALVASDSAGGMFSFQNPETSAIMILDVALEVRTAATGACTVDVGVGSSAAADDDSLIDGQDVNAAAGVFKAPVGARLDANGGTNDFLTASVATGASAGIVGSMFVTYCVIE